MCIYTVTQNEQYDSREVFFAEKPAAEILAALKALRMRWNGKKSCWYGFASAEQIEAAINGQQPAADAEEKTESSKPARRESKQIERKHGVKVGDVFYASWGYEQTNVNFFQVVELRGAGSAIVREVGLEIAEEEAVSGMSADRSYKIPGAILPSASHRSFIDSEEGDLRRIMISKYDGKPYIKVGKPRCYQETAHPYDGRKLYESWYY